ncbi:MAG: hypothetical protein ABFD50_22835 [Smithella sp.]
MRKIFILVFVLFICVAFTCTSSAAASKKGGVDNPENAKQGIMPSDQTKGVKSGKDNQPKAKVDKANNANVGKKVEKKNEQQKK